MADFVLSGVRAEDRGLVPGLLRHRGGAGDHPPASQAADQLRVRHAPVALARQARHAPHVEVSVRAVRRHSLCERRYRTHTSLSELTLVECKQ